MTTVEPPAFARELLRWRTARRVSQLELASRAGTTQRYVSFIERGRSVPGRAVVLRLAESLELTLRERNALLLAAGYAPAYPESPLEASQLGAVREALGGVLEGHLPYPAVVAGPRGDLVAANAAFEVLTEGADPALLEPPANLLRLALHPRGMAPRVLNLGAWGRHIVENVRARAARSPDPGLDALADELAGYVPPYAPDEDYLGFAVPLRLRCAEGELRLLTTLTSFATAVDVTLAELQLEAFLPADGPTAELLRERAARRG
ncbi:helix-turn-helix transcriptional regulator [Streptomyces sp. NPDC005209]|uniref:helix-turn-helix domain-containing protein n=1 Tax=Streptomyces sp. NPDC005209 TaxID=3156715 RepID=UPI0033B9E9DB